jgi:hypothetical protein
MENNKKQIDIKKNVETYKNFLNSLLDIDEKYKGTKEHEKKLRIIYKEMEEIQFNIFNYIQQIGGKPIKEKLKRARGSYNKKNNFVNTHFNDTKEEKK